jgi:hypothetical protein
VGAGAVVVGAGGVGLAVAVAAGRAATADPDTELRFPLVLATVPCAPVLFVCPDGGHNEESADALGGSTKLELRFSLVLAVVPGVLVLFVCPDAAVEAGGGAPAGDPVCALPPASLVMVVVVVALRVAVAVVAAVVAAAVVAAAVVVVAAVGLAVAVAAGRAATADPDTELRFSLVLATVPCAPVLFVCPDAAVEAGGGTPAGDTVCAMPPASLVMVVVVLRAAAVVAAVGLAVAVAVSRAADPDTELRFSLVLATVPCAPVLFVCPDGGHNEESADALGGSTKLVMSPLCSLLALSLIDRNTSARKKMRVRRGRGVEEREREAPAELTRRAA